MGRLDQDDWGVAEDAAKWFHCMQGPDAERSRIAFEEWYEESPVHQHEYFLASFVGMQMASLRGHATSLRDTVERPDEQKVVPLRPVDPKENTQRPFFSSSARTGSIGPRAGGCSSFGAPAAPGLVAKAAPHGKRYGAGAQQAPPEAPRRARMACGAAIAMLVLGFLWNYGVVADRDIYSTTTGEHRTIHLADGTVLELNTGSRVAVSITKERRALELIEGEMFLDVGRDPRPFEVRVGSALIEDVGTRFTLRRRADSLDVAVESGQVRVAVAPRVRGGNAPKRPLAELTAGQVATTSILADAPAPAIRTVSPAQIGDILAWRTGELVFSGETLGAIVEEINRYNARQIQIVDPDVALLRLGGRFRATEPEEFAQMLAVTFRVQVITPGASAPRTEPIRLVGLVQ